MSCDNKDKCKVSGHECSGDLFAPQKNSKKNEPVWLLVFVLAFTCLVAGVGLSYTYNVTKDKIENAELAAELDSVKRVLPFFEGSPEVKAVLIEGKAKDFYVGYLNGNPVGCATKVTAAGYGGRLDLLVGVDLNDSVSGVVLLQHQETPGLGAKAAESSFLKQFNKMKIGGAVAAEIKVKKDGGEIDAITAATITSRAVSRGVTSALEIFRKYKKDIFA